MSYKVGDYVVLEKIGHEGEVCYVGETEFAEGLWLGIELLKGKGKNDGSVDGVRYFDCDVRKGLFVRPTKVAYKTRHPKKKPGQTRTKVKHKKHASVGGSTHDIYAEPVRRRVRRVSKRRVSRKLGPRDIGRSEYVPPPSKHRDSTSDFLAPKVSSATRKKRKQVKVVPRKEGPTDTGRIEYDGETYEERSDSEFLGYRTSRAKPKTSRLLDGTASYAHRKRMEGSETPPGSVSPALTYSAAAALPESDTKEFEASDALADADSAYDEEYEEDMEEEYEEIYEEIEVEVRIEVDSDGNEYEVEVPIELVDVDKFV